MPKISSNRYRFVDAATGQDYFPAVQGARTVKISLSQLIDLINTDSSINDRLTEMEDQFVVAVYFSEITSPDVSAVISLPVAGTLLSGGFSGGADVLINQLSGGVPIDEVALDDAGNPITGSLTGTTVNLTVVSGTYTGAVAIVYAYLVAWSDYDRAYDLNPAPVFAGLSPGDVRGVADWIDVTDNGDGTITVDADASLKAFVASKAQASGLASLDASSLVIQNPANATATPTASKIPIADVSAKLDDWISPASETVDGLVELATTTEVIAGTDTARAITAASLNVSQGLLKNPLALSQAVNITAASSGSNGITIADNDDLDFGTGPFSLFWRVALPDWTPSTNQIIETKLTGGVGYQFEVVATTGLLRLTLNATVYNSSVAPTLTDGYWAVIETIVTPGTTNTTVDFYVNGLLLGSQQTAANPGTVSNAADLYLMGTSTTRTAGLFGGFIAYNRAQAADGVKKLYYQGPEYSDQWGAQGTIVSGNWLNGYSASFDSFSSTGPDNFSGSNATTETIRVRVAGVVKSYKRYRISFVATHSNSPSMSFAACNDSYSGTGTLTTTLTVTSGVPYSVEITAPAILSTTTSIMIVWAIMAGDSVTISDLIVEGIGATCAVLPEAFQPHPGQLLDVANGNHALMPADGATLLLPFEGPTRYEFTTGTSSQYVHGGTTRAIFPVGNFWIDEIYVYSAGAPTLTMGDSAAAPATLVASVTLTAATWTSLALLKHSTTADDLYIAFTAGGAATNVVIVGHKIKMGEY